MRVITPLSIPRRDAIVTTDLDRAIHWVNSAAEQAFGYTPAELLGRKIDILLDQTETLREGLFRKGPDKASPLFRSLPAKRAAIWPFSPCHSVNGRWTIMSSQRPSGGTLPNGLRQKPP